MKLGITICLKNEARVTSRLKNEVRSYELPEKLIL